MIITLTGADFKASNIGKLSDYNVICKIGGGATYNGPAYVNKNSSYNATISTYDGYVFNSALLNFTMGGQPLDSSHYLLSQDNTVITFTIPQVIGNIVLIAPTKTTFNEENELSWGYASFNLESGSTNDDAIGTMGNKVANINRTRTANAINGKVVEITLRSSEMSLWFNVFNESGQLMDTSKATVHPATDTYRINAAGFGGSKVWPIFRTKTGTSPLTDEQLSTIIIKTANPTWDIISTKLEQGTFDDNTGEKVNSEGRIRTAEKVVVPENVTGLRFVGTGTLDLWIKGYSQNIAKPDLCNGIGSTVSGKYWSTVTSKNTLTWADICPSGKKPAYLDFVIKSNSLTLLPADVYGAIIAFTY